MPNKKYAQGYNFELRVANHLKSLGYATMTARGSHGIADIVGIHAAAVLWVQCKTGGRISSADQQDLYDEAVTHGMVPVIASRGPKPRCEIIYQEVKSQDCLPWKQAFDPEECLKIVM